jgi:energy-converting hydrogenase A subunit M
MIKLCCQKIARILGVNAHEVTEIYSQAKEDFFTVEDIHSSVLSRDEIQEVLIYLTLFNGLELFLCSGKEDGILCLEKTRTESLQKEQEYEMIFRRRS